MPRCQSKQILLRGLRPSPQQKIHCSTCRRRCIFCDIWKLASLVFTHVRLSQRYSTTPEKLRSLSSEPSYDYARTEKIIEAAFMNEQFKLQSIMSICTVEGAEESIGLRMAHDRCLETVAQLLQEEEKLELALIRAPSPDYYSGRRTSHTQYHDQRRPSMVSMVAWAWRHDLELLRAIFSERWIINEDTITDFHLLAQVFRNKKAICTTGLWDMGRSKALDFLVYHDTTWETYSPPV